MRSHDTKASCDLQAEVYVTKSATKRTTARLDRISFAIVLPD